MNDNKTNRLDDCGIPTDPKARAAFMERVDQYHDEYDRFEHNEEVEEAEQRSRSSWATGRGVRS